MKCKDCKWFYLETIQFVSIPPKDIGRCSNRLLCPSGDGAIECPTNGILADCDEGRGELEVGPEFGCIHFEKQTNEQ